MSLDPFLNEFFKTPDAKECCNAIKKYMSQCDTVIEFGCRGGITAIAILQALLDGKKKFNPRLVGVDLIFDESINKIAEIAKKIGVSYQFWKGHTMDFPTFETDGFLWDTFHCYGNLLADLNSHSDYINKFIIIIGTSIDGEKSEAIRRNLDTEMVAQELRINSSTVNKGLKFAIDEFLEKNSSWVKDLVLGDITVLKRTEPIKNPLFKCT